MRLYESILQGALSTLECKVEDIVLGWRGSYVSLADGRWGVGATPRAEDESLSSREDHTRTILSSTSHGLARLVVSPYPQEFAAATAALCALLPAEGEGAPLDSLISAMSGEEVFLVAPAPGAVDFLTDCGLDVSIFDDSRRGRRVRPLWSTQQHLRRSGWLWINADALRDRAILALAPSFKGMRGVVLQGPGIPFLPTVLGELGVTCIVAPRAEASSRLEVRRYVAAGGAPWSCPTLAWRVFDLLYTDGESR